MPDYTVKADVDTMLRANDKAAIRSAIGVGQTDVPTFAGVTSTGVLSLPVGSTSATAIRFGTQGATTGLYSSNAGTNPGIGFAIGGTAYIFSGDSGRGLCLHSGWPLSWGSNQADSTPGLFLYRDGADGILAQRNLTNAQAFRVYRSYDTAANSFEWFGATWQGGVCYVGTEKTGVGASRILALRSGGEMYFEVAGANRWNISTAGHFLAVADNAHDIGASGANRPKDIYAGSNVRAPVITAASALISSDYVQCIRVLLGTGATSRIQSSADGVVKLSNNADNSFTRLELGEANMGIMRGAGTPEGAVTAKVGSIFLRTDGGASTTLYVKESGTGNTGWVAK